MPSLLIRRPSLYVGSFSELIASKGKQPVATWFVPRKMLANVARGFQPENSSMPRGRPRINANLSKMDAMRKTLAALGNDAMPGAIDDYLRKEFGILMSPGMIANYKSTIKSEGSKSRLISRSVTRKIAGEFSLEEIQSVKEVADKIGADKLRQLAQVLGD